jgi:hypothetical protein
MPSTYEKIATQTLGSATATVTFTSISGAYTDLVLVTDNIFNTSNLAAAYLRFNSDTGTNYSYQSMQGTGTVANAERGSNQNVMYVARSFGGDQTYNIISIMNYSNTTTNKSVLSRYGSGGASSGVLAAVGLWRSTSAISTILMGIDGGYNFSSGATFTLYGILKAA